MKILELIKYLKGYPEENEVFWLNIGQDTGDLTPFEEDIDVRFIIKTAEKELNNCGARE